MYVAYLQKITRQAMDPFLFFLLTYTMWSKRQQYGGLLITEPRGIV